MRSRALPPARLLAVVAPVSIVGVAAYCAATFHFVTHPGSATDVAGVVAFLVASTLAERYPVPVEGADANGVSLGFVFAVAALVLFGWAPATFVYATAPTLVALARPPAADPHVFNAGVFGIVGTLAGLVLTHIHGDDSGDGARAGRRHGGDPLRGQHPDRHRGDRRVGLAAQLLALIRSNVRWTIVPFTLMASTALMLVVLWQRTPWLFAALAGPLVAISLYQRSTHRALNAIRLALTDPLTGLGNHRHFQERLQRELATAEDEDGTRLALPARRRQLQADQRPLRPPGRRPRPRRRSRHACARAARRSGSAATSSRCCSRASTSSAAIAIARRRSSSAIGETDLGPSDAITVSAGVATFPQHARERDSLIRLADGALYWAKEHGKNQVRLARGRRHRARARACRRVARRRQPRGALQARPRSRSAVDARDALHRQPLRAGRRPRRADRRAARPAARGDRAGRLAAAAARPRQARDPGGDPAQAGRSRARSGSSSSGTRRSARACSRASARPIADWVLHHHERWDGAGYPAGLAGRRSRSARGSSSSPTRSTR